MFLWKMGILPGQWGLAKGCYVLKQENSEGMKQLRPLSLISIDANRVDMKSP